MKPLLPDDIVAASPRVASTRLGDEAALLSLDGGFYYGLNETGARIWELLREPIRVRSVEETIAAEYDVEGATAAEEVAQLLDSLREQGLIEVREGAH